MINFVVVTTALDIRCYLGRVGDRVLFVYIRVCCLVFTDQFHTAVSIFCRRVTSVVAIPLFIVCDFFLFLLAFFASKSARSHFVRCVCWSGAS